MKKYLITSLMACMATTLWGQISYLTNPDVAVFQPANYDGTQHEPSPIFERPLTPTAQVPDAWKVRPTYTTADGKSIATLPVDEGTDLYGTGEVVGPLRRNGQEVEFWNKDNFGYQAADGKRLYQSHPWVLGIRADGTAFGVIADNSWRATLRTDDRSLTFKSDGPAFRVIVIEKQNPREVMRELANLTGHMELPALWTLGHQQCRYSYNPDSRVKEIADSLRLKRIPTDVIWMDIDYMDKFKIFTFDPVQFPDPKGLNDYLHARHFKSVYMIDPGVKVEPGYFVDDQGTAGDYWVKTATGEPFVGRVWPGDCHFPDFTRPDVRRWWSTLYKDYLATGIDGVWNDMNDPSVFGGEDGSMPADNQHLGGEGLPAGSHLRYHNLFGYYMVKGTHDGNLLANPDKRPFTLSRSSFLGGQRYAATWTGDNLACWDHLKLSIPMTLNLSLSGLPFNGPDLGGFGADTDAELLAHWACTDVYFPFVRNHAAKGTIQQEPWCFGQKVEDVYRTAVNRRYRLLPYIYTLFEEAASQGQPVMRPAFWADFTDLSLRAEQEAFMLGDALYVIPRWAKEATLPKGDWDPLQLETVDDGYQAIVCQRAGSIVPLANLYQNTEEYRTDSLTLLVNPAADGTASGTLYEDAGNGFEYRKGQYARYELKAETNAKGVITVSLKQTEGLRQSAPKTLRIGFVTDGKITYSPWTTAAESVSMKTVKDKVQGLERKNLRFSDIDISAQPTLEQKMEIMMNRMKAAGHANEW
jgi:alpha-glucosidase